MRDPAAYSPMDRMIEAAEDEYDTAVSHVERAIADLEKQRGDLTDHAISDAINGMRDIASELRGAKAALARIYHGEDAA